MNKRKQTATAVTAIQPWFVTVPEAAIILGVGKSTIYKLMDTEGLPKVKFGTAVRIPVKPLQEWLTQREGKQIA